jgi:hypothetical protein
MNYLNGEIANQLSIDQLNVVHGGKGGGKGTRPGTGGGDAWDGFAMRLALSKPL